MSGITAIKIYGERNTGTNYVSELLRVNFDLPELPGVEQLTTFDWAMFITLKRLGSERALHWAYNRAVNRYHAKTFDQNFGWKHARVPVDRIDELAPRNVGFLGLVKNPYAYVTSLHRRPYHHDATRQDLSHFVSEPFTLHARDMMGDAVATPVQLWVAKTRSYFEMAHQIERAIVARYEDFLSDEEGQLTELAKAWDLKSPDVFQTVEVSTKAKTKNRSWYSTYYLQQHWRDDLSDEAITAINKQLDPQLMEMCGYEMIAPSLGPASTKTQTTTATPQAGKSVSKTVAQGASLSAIQNGPMWVTDAPLSTSRLNA